MATRCFDRLPTIPSVSGFRALAGHLCKEPKCDEAWWMHCLDGRPYSAAKWDGTFSCGKSVEPNCGAIVAGKDAVCQAIPWSSIAAGRTAAELLILIPCELLLRHRHNASYGSAHSREASGSALQGLHRRPARRHAGRSR